MKDDLWTWAEDGVDLTPEQHRWRARDVSYYRGLWNRLKAMIPGFELAPFRLAEDAPENQHLRMVVRQPISQTEQPIPIPAKSAFDVMQAMSFVATGRRDAIEQQNMLRELDRPLDVLQTRQAA